MGGWGRCAYLGLRGGMCLKIVLWGVCEVGGRAMGTSPHGAARAPAVGKGEKPRGQERAVPFVGRVGDFWVTIGCLSGYKTKSTLCLHGLGR